MFVWLQLVSPVWLLAMFALLVASAFFSCSEAALFYLPRRDRRRMAVGNRAQIAAIRLLEDADRLLTAILFWNLVINVTYFAIASIVSLRLERADYRSEAGQFAVGSLLTIILFSEMFPKSFGVSQPRLMASLLALPLSLAVRMVDPLMPTLQTVNLLSQRLIWPSFAPEPYLEVGDLERAVEMSTSDAALLAQEQLVLQNILGLSQVRAVETMRPRMWLAARRPPISLADVEGELPPTGYVFVTESDSDELFGAIPLSRFADVPETHLERFAESLVYVPWSASVSAVMDKLRRQDRRVAAVVNEHGETIGAITFDDILDAILAPESSRTHRLLAQQPIREVAPGVWHVIGITTLRRLATELDVELPSSKSHTTAGVVQELLERLPKVGDRQTWGPLEFNVLEVSERGPLLVEVTKIPQPADGEAET